MPRIYCDLDGTLIYRDLEKEFINFLRENHKFTFKHYFMACISIPFNTVMRKKNKGSLYKSWTIGCSEERQQELFGEFFDKSLEKLEIRQKVLTFLNNMQSEYEIILLTGSYRKLAEAFLEKQNICELFDRVIGCEVQKNGFKVTTHPYGIDKCVYIEKDSHVIGIANEYADRFYLSLCDEAYIVGDDLNLIKFANERGWRHI